MIDFETTGSVTAKKGLRKQDSYFDFCEGKQHQRKEECRMDRSNVPPFQHSTFQARKSNTAQDCSAVQKTCACNVSVFSGIKESPAEDSMVGVPDSAIWGSTQSQTELLLELTCLPPLMKEKEETYQ